jgi:predicted nucleotidyltransferase
MEMLATIRKKLQEIKPELVSKYHISSIGLFGSVFRDDFTPESDIDIVVDFSRPIGIEFIDLANELEAIFKRRIDLVSKNGIKPGYMKAIQSEIIYV